MRLISIALAAPLGLTFALSGAVQAQQSRMLCAERDSILTTLTDRYGEEVRGMGLAPNNRIVEVFVSEETGSWTITLTSADGVTCLMAAGQHYEQMVPVAGGEDL